MVTTGRRLCHIAISAPVHLHNAVIHGICTGPWQGTEPWQGKLLAVMLIQHGLRHADQPYAREAAHLRESQPWQQPVAHDQPVLGGRKLRSCHCGARQMLVSCCIYRCWRVSWHPKFLCKPCYQWHCHLTVGQHAIKVTHGLQAGERPSSICIAVRLLAHRTLTKLCLYLRCSSKFFKRL